MRQLLLLFMILFVFTACASKEDTKQEYNKPAIFWYNKMLKQIASYQIDEADDTYTSLESEHRNSPLLSSAIFIIAMAHLDEEEYAMANYYFDEYLKRFSIASNIDYVRYLKIKSKFLAFKNQFREQELVYDTLKETQNFIDTYPNSNYLYLVHTIKSRLEMAKASFDTEIAQLYKRIDKPKASDIYLSRAKRSWEDIDTIEPIIVPWYRRMFE